MTVYVGILPADADARGCGVRVWFGITASLTVASWRVRVQPCKYGLSFSGKWSAMRGIWYFLALAGVP